MRIPKIEMSCRWIIPFRIPTVAHSSHYCKMSSQILRIFIVILSIQKDFFSRNATQHETQMSWIFISTCQHLDHAHYSNLTDRPTTSVPRCLESFNTQQRFFPFFKPKCWLWFESCRPPYKIQSIPLIKKTLSLERDKRTDFPRDSGTRVRPLLLYSATCPQRSVKALPIKRRE